MKNFQNVESYINIMDIIRNLTCIASLNDEGDSEEEIKEQMKEIIPKTIQMKIKDKLGPILSQKYEE